MGIPFLLVKMKQRVDLHDTADPLRVEQHRNVDERKPVTFQDQNQDVDRANEQYEDGVDQQVIRAEPDGRPNRRNGTEQSGVHR